MDILLLLRTIECRLRKVYDVVECENCGAGIVIASNCDINGSFAKDVGCCDRPRWQMIGDEVLHERPKECYGIFLK